MNTMKISLSDRVYETLEDAILDGKYAAGEYLTEIKLSEELGVSRTPIREALHRLAQEGLIEETTRGVLVVGISEDDIAVIYEIRARIEGYAARLFTERVTDDMIRELQDNIELQEFYKDRDSALNSRNLDTRFHEVIYKNCGSRILEDMLLSLHRKVRRCRLLLLEDHERAKQAAVEHRDILEAIKNRDGELAETLVIRHIRDASRSIIEKLRNKDGGEK